MANNPFYPGYIPDPKNEQPQNPLYPGFYPGRAQPRLPKKLPNLKPWEYNWDDAVFYLNLLESELNQSTLGMPTWMYERAISDFNQTLQAYIKPKSVDVADLDDFDASAMPGAFGLGFDLNPAEWIKDPGAKLQKTVVGWGKTGLNWGDLETRFREKLWTQVVSDTPVYGFKGQEQAAQAILERTGRAYGMVPTGIGPNPLALKGLGIKGDFVDPKKQKAALEVVWDATANGGAGGWKVDQIKTKEQADVYLNVANSLIGFEKAAGFGPAREAKYDDINIAMMGAIQVELSDPTHLAAIRADPELKEAWDVFNAKHDMASQMQLLGDRFRKVQETISDEALKGAATRNKPTAFLAGDINFGRFKDLREQIDNTLTNIDSYLGAAGALNSYTEEARVLREFFEPYKKHLADVRKEIITPQIDSIILRKASIDDDYRNKKITEEMQKAQIKALQQEYATQVLPTLSALERLGTGGLGGRGLTGGDLLSQSYYRKLIRDTIENDMLNPRSKGKKKRIGDVIDALPNVYAKRLKPYASRILYERQIMAFDEFLNTVEKGKFLEIYVWNRLNNYLKATTPAFYAAKALEKVHYFGLKLGDKEKSVEAVPLFRMLGARAGQAPGRVIGNWFDVKNDVSMAKLLNPSGRNPGALAAYGGVTNFRLSGKIYGGAHFDGVKTLGQLHGMLLTDEWTPNGLMYLIHNINDKDAFSNPTFIAALKAANGGKMPVLPSGVTQEKFAKQIMDFRKWVIANRDRFNTNVNKDSEAFWIGVIATLNKQSLNADYLSITKKYAGALEKLWSNFNRLQSWVIKKFGKYLAPFAYAKNILAERIADLLPKLLSLVGGALTGGASIALLETIGRIFRPIIRLVIVKTMDFVQNFIGGIAKGDFFRAFREIDKLVQKLLKFIIILFSLPILIIMFISNTFFGATFTTVSPVDSSQGVFEEVLVFPPPGALIFPPNMPPGPYGSGAGCSGVHPIPSLSGVRHHCYHWDGYRPLDMFGSTGTPIVAPFTGVAVAYTDSVGGNVVMLYPDPVAAPNCPSLYFAHLNGRGVSGNVTQSQQIGAMGATGSAAASGPHLHLASSTNGYFFSSTLDVCVVQLLSDWGFSCNDTAAGYGGPPLCCNANYDGNPYPIRNGCEAAANQ